MLKFQYLLSSHVIERFRNGYFTKVERAFCSQIRYKNMGIAIYNFGSLHHSLEWCKWLKKGMEKDMGSRPRISQQKVVQLVSELSGLTQKQCRVVLEDYITVLRNCCLNGVEVSLPTMGVLTQKYKPYRDPITLPNVAYGGKMMPTSPREEHNIPSFRMYKAFVEEMKELTWKNPVWKPQEGKVDIDTEDELEEGDDSE